MARTPKGHRILHNEDPVATVVGSMPKDMVKADFGRRLNRAIVAKGWNQSEFSRQTTRHTPRGGTPLTRDLVSKYIGGKVIPNPVNLKIILDTLGIKREDLLPAGVMPEAGDAIPPIDVRDAGEGMVWLRVNQAVPWATALAVLNILKGEGSK